MSSSVLKQTKELPALLEIPAHRQDACEALIRSEKLASLGRMASTILHDINNPLAAAMNLLFLAQNDPNCPMSVREDLGKAESELQRILQNARQVLGSYRDAAGLSKISSPRRWKRHSARSKPESWPREWRLRSDIAKKAVSSASRETCGRSSRISSLIASMRLARAAGSRYVSRNAARTVIEWRASPSPITARGIDASALPRIFEPLFTTKESVGTGLGLWVAKQLVQKLGGSIRFRSTAGPERRGTTFVIDLPAVPVDPRS